VVVARKTSTTTAKPPVNRPEAANSGSKWTWTSLDWGMVAHPSYDGRKLHLTPEAKYRIDESAGQIREGEAPAEPFRYRLGGSLALPKDATLQIFLVNAGDH
jgi:hypothetical protein